MHHAPTTPTARGGKAASCQAVAGGVTGQAGGWPVGPAPPEGPGGGVLVPHGLEQPHALLEPPVVLPAIIMTTTSTQSAPWLLRHHTMPAAGCLSVHACSMARTYRLVGPLDPLDDLPPHVPLLHPAPAAAAAAHMHHACQDDDTSEPRRQTDGRASRRLVVLAGWLADLRMTWSLRHLSPSASVAPRFSLAR